VIRKAPERQRTPAEMKAGQHEESRGQGGEHGKELNRIENPSGMLMPQSQKELPTTRTPFCCKKDIVLRPNSGELSSPLSREN